TLGMSCLVTSSDLVTVYLSVELQSLPLYILACLYRDSEPATSAALKYFLIGALSSCLFLLGSLAVLIKLPAAPFHYWAPDVYDGVPTLVTSWLAIMPKVALLAFLALYQGLTQIGGIVVTEHSYDKPLGVLATCSRVGYSPGSGGLSLLPFPVRGYQLQPILRPASQPKPEKDEESYWLEGLSVMRTATTKPLLISSEYNRISCFHSNPVLALSFAICLFSMAGIPPLIGFFCVISTGFYLRAGCLVGVGPEASSFHGDCYLEPYYHSVPSLSLSLIKLPASYCSFLLLLVMSTLIMYFCFVPLFTATLMVINNRVGVKKGDPAKVSPYECGFAPVGTSRQKFSVSFFLVAILFLTFDLEILFVYPFAMSLCHLSLLGYWVFIVFSLILTVAFVYELGIGALNYATKASSSSLTSSQNSPRDSNRTKQEANKENRFPRVTRFSVRKPGAARSYGGLLLGYLFGIVYYTCLQGRVAQESLKSQQDRLWLTTLALIKLLSA
ncbi:30306_t:CDS:2, partial [Racocetra persica]